MSTNNKVIMHEALIVRKMKEQRSIRFGIYRGTKLLEGGFFSAWAAEASAKEYSVDGEEVLKA